MTEQKFLVGMPVRFLVLALYAAVFLFLIPAWWDKAWFVIGILSGVILLIGDETKFHVWYQEKGEPNFLVTRSPIFWLSLAPMSVIVLMSFGSVWANGLMGSLMLLLLLEMGELREQPAQFQQRFFQGAQTNLARQTIDILLWSGVAIFLVLHLLAIL